MRTDIFGLNGYAGCVDEQGYVYRVSRNQALSNDACIGKIDSNGNVYRQAKTDLTSNSNIVGNWSGDGSIYVVGDSMLRGSNYIGAYDSRGYVYLNAKNELNSSENQAGFVQGNIPYGAAALLLLLMPAYEENSQSNRKKSSRGNKTRGQQRRMNQDGSRNRDNNKAQSNKRTNANSLKYPKETYLAYGIGIAILILLGYCLAKIAKAILYAATSVSFIATVIFLVFGWKLQKQVILGRQNKRLTDNDKRIIWQWVILCAVIVAIIGVVQDVINSSYIGSNIIWIFIGLSVYYLFFSAQYKLGKFDVSPVEFVTGKRDFSNQGKDRNVKSRQAKKSKGNSKNQSKSNSDYILLQCNECGQKSRIPANRGMLLVTCPRCGNTCEVES